jgi:hypothetical protein
MKSIIVIVLFLGALAARAQSPGADGADESGERFTTLLRNYQQGRKDYAVMPYLAMTASKLGDKDTAAMIVDDYKNNYFNTLTDDQICSKDLLLFINQFADRFLFPEGSKGKLFSLDYKNPDKVDKAAEWPGFADFEVRYVIRIEEIENKLWRGDKPLAKKPDWGKMRDNIRGKYGTVYADSLVPPAQRDFYKRIGNWREYGKLRDQGIRDDPPRAGAGVFAENGSVRLNDDAWDAFLHCGDRSVLRRALRWVELSIQMEASEPNDGHLDTRANLLYKLGRVKEAIAQEEKAKELEIARKKRNGNWKDESVSDYSETLDKMKKGEPTWPTK